MILPLMPIVFAFLIPGNGFGSGESANRPCRTLVAVTADTTVDRDSDRASPLLGWIPGRGPAYPQELQGLRHGEVVATYVVDTTGRVVRASAEIISESDVGFGRSVCAFLDRAKFKPASVSGRKLSVRVLAATFQFDFGI
jgi:TonB family protein